MKINELIKSKRKEKNLTQQELADLLYVSPKTISKWETGRGLPELASITKLSETLGISAEEMMCSVTESTEGETIKIDLGIKNAMIISFFVMMIGIVLFGIANFSLYRTDYYILYYLLSGIFIFGAIALYFILENNRNLKIGYRKRESINSERRIIILLWACLLAIAPFIQYMAYFREAIEKSEMLIVIAFEYAVSFIFLIVVYKTAVKR